MTHPLIIGRIGSILTTLPLFNHLIGENSILGLRTNDIVNSWQNYRILIGFSGINRGKF
jgi:hypothetical protein